MLPESCAVGNFEMDEDVECMVMLASDTKEEAWCTMVVVHRSVGWLVDGDYNTVALEVDGLVVGMVETFSLVLQMQMIVGKWLFE